MLFQEQTYRTPKRSIQMTETRPPTASSNEPKRPFRPERGYEVTGIIDSENDTEEDEYPPKAQNVPYDPDRARRDKLRRKAERKAREAKEQERRQEMTRHQSRESSKSTSPVRQTSQWDKPRTHEAERKKSPTRPPRGPNEYKKTYTTGSADRSHRNYKDY